MHMSVLVIVGSKCTAPGESRWVWLRDRQTDRLTATQLMPDVPEKCDKTDKNDVRVAQLDTTNKLSECIWKHGKQYWFSLHQVTLVLSRSIENRSRILFKAGGWTSSERRWLGSSLDADVHWWIASTLALRAAINRYVAGRTCRRRTRGRSTGASRRAPGRVKHDDRGRRPWGTGRPFACRLSVLAACLYLLAQCYRGSWRHRPSMK